MTSPRLLRALLAAAVLVGLGGLANAAESPLVAIPPARLFLPDSEKSAAPLAELVRIALQTDPALADTRFVERIALDTLLREQSLALAGAHDSTAAVRTGRLLHADWLLRLRLRADDPRRPRVEVEVIEALRAELLARIEEPLAASPDENWLLSPSPSAVRLAATAATRALAAASTRASSLAGRTVVAPLVFINRTGTDRLAPLAAKFLAALRADHPATHALGYADPESARAESTLFLAGLTELDPVVWSRVADAYLWGEFAEDADYTGPVAATPVTLALRLWRAGDAPDELSFTGTLATLDDLALRAASATLDASTGARLAPTLAARRTASDRLLAAAAPLAKEPDTHYLSRKETPRARLGRSTSHAQLLGLASFFSPEDADLREQHLACRLRLAGNTAERTPWDDAFWLHFDQRFPAAGETPDLALLNRAILDHDPYHAYARPGFAARTLRIGQALKKCPPGEPVVRELWDRFLQAAATLPDEPGLPSALESLWPLVRRAQPDLADFTVRADITLRKTLAHIYRADPARLRSLLTDQLLPLDLTPLPVPLSLASSPLSPPPEPRIFLPKPTPSALAANPFTAWQNTPSETLLDLARTGPLADLPSLAAPAATLPAWPLAAPGAAIPSSARFPALPGRAFFNDLATDGRSIWLAFVSPADDSAAWRNHRAARLDLATASLAWPTDLASAPATVTRFWPESADELWITTRGAGLRILRPAPAPSLVFDSAHGLPNDDIPDLRRGHDAVFLAPASSGANEPAVHTVTAISLHDHALSQRPALATPELSPLRAAVRAAIASFPDDAPARVHLPDTPAIALPPPGPSSTPPAFERRPSTLRAEIAPNDPATTPRLALLTGPRDGYWVASDRTVLWASGSRRVPLVHWLHGAIFALADDGRRLFIRVTTLHRAEWSSFGEHPPTPDTTRVYVYDHSAARWLGWLPLPSEGFLSAGGDRLLIAFGPYRPITVIDTAQLRPLDAPTTTTAVLAARPPSTRATADPERDRRKEAVRRRDAAYEAIRHPPTDLALLTAELDAGLDPVATENDSTPLVLAALHAKNHPVVALFLSRLRPADLARVSAQRPVGLTLLHGLLEARRPDLARQIIDLGYLPASDRPDVTDSLGWLAIRSGDVAIVAALHKAGFPLETTVGQHALREAVAQQNLPLLRLLLATPRADGRTRDPDDSSGNGLTPLFAATDLGWIEGVRALLGAGVRDFCGDRATGRTLSDAAAPWPEVALLLNRRPDAPDNRLDGARAVAAIFKGDPATLAALPLPPAVLRYRDFWDWTVLHHAARAGRAPFVRRLLAAHAPIDRLTTAGESALCLAAFHGDSATLAALLQAGADANLRRDQAWLPLHAAARAGRADLVKLLLAARADPRPRVGDDASPVLLLAAAVPGDLETTRLLVEAGAPLDAVDASGFGPLEAAVVSDSPEKIQYLLDHGARWQKPTGPDYHPMDVAAKRGLSGSIRKLRQLGLRSPRALSLAKDDATRALLQDDDSAAGRLSRFDEEQWPAILGEPDPARLRERLAAHLKAGGAPNHLSAAWGTPLDLAVARHDPDLVRLLIARGADPSIRSKGLVDGALGVQIRPRTSLHAWLSGQACLHEKNGTLPPERDAVALAYLPIFWPHEPAQEPREEMIRWAVNAELPQAAAWMRAHLSDKPRLAAP